jgi:large conductance mechanosensitive channel
LSPSGEIIAQEVSIQYGAFFETFLDFTIVAFTIFIVIKFINRLQVKAEDTNDETVKTPKNLVLLSQISESLKELNTNLKK